MNETDEREEWCSNALAGVLPAWKQSYSCVLTNLSSTLHQQFLLPAKGDVRVYEEFEEEDSLIINILQIKMRKDKALAYSISKLQNYISCMALLIIARVKANCMNETHISFLNQLA